MKRDLKLVTEILKAVEEQKGIHFIQADELDIEGWSMDEINYNVELMDNGGLLEAERKAFLGGGVIMIIRNITWEGHDFLEAAKNEAVWEKADKEAEEKGSKLKDLPYEVAKGLLVSASKQLFGL